MKKLLIIALLFLSLSTFAQERIALVIGNGDYHINPLANTLNDAQDMAKALEDLDFKVTLLQNANRKTMRDAIYDFNDKLNKDTVGLFYYAGHAAQYHGENYLIPILAMQEILENAPLAIRASKNLFNSLLVFIYMISYTIQYMLEQDYLNHFQNFANHCLS